MHFPSLLTCLTLFTSSVLAAPALAARAATITFNPGTPTSAPKAPYILKTRVRNAANPSKPVDKSKVKYNNLYLWAYHTGAGLNDAVVSNNKSIASPGFLNATAQQFKLGQYNYGFNFEIGTYSGWGEVQINAGVQTKGFSFTKQHGLVWGGKSGTEAASFGGWLVCDWWHGKGQSQVFWRNKYFPLSSYPTLATCADVDLIPQSVSK